MFFSYFIFSIQTISLIFRPIIWFHPKYLLDYVTKIRAQYSIYFHLNSNYQYRQIQLRGNVVIKYIFYLNFNEQFYKYQFIANKLNLEIMGNQPCAQCTANVQQNKAYGDFQLIQSQGYMVAVVQKKVERDQKLKCQILAKLQQRKNIKNSHIVRMIKYQIKQQGYGYQVLMHYQYIVKTLQDRVNDLQFRGLFFTQKQLFAIIYGVENALKVLEENKIKHSCINMETIVCKNNFYKITDVSSTTYVTSYNLAVKGDRKQFLSQKLLQSLAHKSLQPPYDIKDDFFSLGMIILSIVSGKDAGDFYEWRPNNNASLKLNTIDLAFKEIERNFSSKLVKKVRSLVFQGLQMDQSQVTNLTDSLQQLDQEFGRVLKKIKRLEIDRKY